MQNNNTRRAGRIALGILTLAFVAGGNVNPSHAAVRAVYDITDPATGSTALHVDEADVTCMEQVVKWAKKAYKGKRPACLYGHIMPEKSQLALDFNMDGLVDQADLAQMREFVESTTVPPGKVLTPAQEVALVRVINGTPPLPIIKVDTASTADGVRRSCPRNTNYPHSRDTQFLCTLSFDVEDTDSTVVMFQAISGFTFTARWIDRGKVYEYPLVSTLKVPTSMWKRGVVFTISPPISCDFAGKIRAVDVLWYNGRGKLGETVTWIAPGETATFSNKQ